MDYEKEYAIDHEKHDAAVRGTLPRSDRLDIQEQNAESAVEETAIEISDAEETAHTSQPPPLDWDNEQDPDNPFNWPLWKRTYNTIIPGFLGLAVTFGSSVYTPAYAQVAAQFHVSTSAALVPLSVWTFGLGFGPLLGAPFSEMFGRKAVYLVSTPISLLFTLGAGLSTTFGGLVACRLLGGLFGSPILAVGAGTINDIYPPKYRARGAAMFIAAPFLGPSLGPFIGGFATMNKGWRYTNWIELIILGLPWIGVFFLSESYKKIILRTRAKRRGHELPPTPAVPPKFLLEMLVLRPIYMLIREPIVLSLSSYVAFAFAVLFAFFAAFPIVFEGIYHFNSGESGLAFFGVGLGVILAVMTALLFDKFVYWKKLAEAQAAGIPTLAPEHRLYAAMLGCFGLPLSLFWFAWTAKASIHWISPILAGVFFGWGNFCIFISCALYLGDTYGPLFGASAMAANGLMRYTLGSVFPLFTIQMYHNLGIGWATSIFGFISVLMLPIPWVLFKWGPLLRTKSQYAPTK